MEVRQLRTDETDLLRDIRLRALQDTPWAFGSTYAREREHTAERWAWFAAQEDSVIYVALDGAKRRVSQSCYKLEIVARLAVPPRPGSRPFRLSPQPIARGDGRWGVPIFHAQSRRQRACPCLLIPA